MTADQMFLVGGVIVFTLTVAVAVVESAIAWLNRR